MECISIYFLWEMIDHGFTSCVPILIRDDVREVHRSNLTMKLYQCFQVINYYISVRRKWLRDNYETENLQPRCVCSARPWSWLLLFAAHAEMHSLLNFLLFFPGRRRVKPQRLRVQINFIPVREMQYFCIPACVTAWSDFQEKNS